MPKIKVTYDYGKSPVQEMIEPQKIVNEILNYYYPIWDESNVARWGTITIPEGPKSQEIYLSGIEYDRVWIDDLEDIWSTNGYGASDGIHPTGKNYFNTVTKPEHYNKNGIEAWDAIKASMTKEEWEGYCKGNVEKYVWRWRYKNGLEDLNKAKAYLEQLIRSVEEDDDKETQAGKY